LQGRSPTGLGESRCRAARLQAEAAFRIQQDELRVRPIWHPREDCVRAHILVCFLAFVLWKTLEM